MQKPSCGRMVHYTLSKNDVPLGRDHLVGQKRPAVVLYTAEEAGWTGYPPEQQVVQLQVFVDGMNDGFPPGETMWKTSVAHDPEGKKPGCWSWPPRV